METIQPSVLYVLGVKQLGHDIDHSSVSIAEAENEWS
jgi:hypothetical protein